ncbi:MAG: 16S rRNA (cytosine(1402)-N(4))-methyltransferase RsmH [Puniceicoccales bacterium]|jgi:16S rRNA (cytosine1402-N4)-methyltransferase|nr:16S rRNA (cytosine(1402)-N(4))-methyltransferase RsmH [Puniceicoccales bacterium]
MNEQNTLTHIPVMLQETVMHLHPQRGGNFLDCTFGGGGHSVYLLENFPNITLFAIDRDPECAIRAHALKQSFGHRFQFFNIAFSAMDSLSLPPLDGIFFDFGISSFQLDDSRRGFSFRYSAPLDMRMNPLKGISAHEFLETAHRRQLEEAVRDFGEERYWRKIVDQILSHRGSDVLKYADQFAAFIARNLPANFRRHIHPATRTFQGLRIAVNEELEEIRKALPLAFEYLKPEGRLVTLSFHSLEDRIVKQFFNAKAGKAMHCHEKYNCRPTLAKILTPKPKEPQHEEILVNPRSRSAKLRALEKF